VAVPGTARLADRGPPTAETIAPVLRIPLGSCDAVASGAEDAQVWLIRGRAELGLCGHHFRELELALAASGWKVTLDNRGDLS
jgi:hypothetical protein